MLKQKVKVMEQDEPRLVLADLDKLEEYLERFSGGNKKLNELELMRFKLHKKVLDLSQYVQDKEQMVSKQDVMVQKMKEFQKKLETKTQKVTQSLLSKQ